MTSPPHLWVLSIDTVQRNLVSCEPSEDHILQLPILLSVEIVIGEDMRGPQHSELTTTVLRDKVLYRITKQF